MNFPDFRLEIAESGNIAGDNSTNLPLEHLLERIDTENRQEEPEETELQLKSPAGVNNNRPFLKGEEAPSEIKDDELQKAPPKRGVVRFNVRIRSYETEFEGEEEKAEKACMSEDYQSSE